MYLETVKGMTTSLVTDSARCVAILSVTPGVNKYGYIPVYYMFYYR